MNNKTLWVDMDGVLVNWVKGAMERIKSDEEIMKRLKRLEDDFGIYIDFNKVDGFDIESALEYYNINIRGMAPKKAKRSAKGRFWKPFQGDSDWWANLEWMPDGQELWNYLVELKQNDKIDELNILSSPSSDPACEVGKREWLSKNGVERDANQIVIKTNKWEEATDSNDILIDDTEKKLYGAGDKPGWETVGGTGVLHTDTSNTIKQLKELGL